MQAGIVRRVLLRMEIGECGREEKKAVQAGWNGWRRMSGVICDRRILARVKGKVYRVAVRPAMLNGLETVALTKRQQADVKMLQFSLGVTRMDKIRNEYTSEGQDRTGGKVCRGNTRGKTEVVLTCTEDR